MDEGTFAVLYGRITGIKFTMATETEICKASNSDFPICHLSQLSNPFLGLPLENGKCESCGASENDQCEGHFGYIELPIPIYHPSHVSELKKLLSAICLKCLKVKGKKVKVKNIGTTEQAFSPCCEEASLISISEQKTKDGARYLQLKVDKSKYRDGFWNFLERYGYKYGDEHSRPVLPSEVMIIMKKLPDDTRKKLIAKGLFPQYGYIMKYLPVPPNCLSVPDVSDGITVVSSDLSAKVLKKILRKIEIVKSTRSGTPNFVAHEVGTNDLQVSISEYLDARGTSKSSCNLDSQVGNKKDTNKSNKAWAEKMKTLFLSKGSNFSSMSVITGDAYIGVNKIGLPSEIAQKITFEEKVTEHNLHYLQKLVDEKLCLSYRDGDSICSLKEGFKGHIYLRPGQTLRRQILNGDIIFINRTPTTHKHSLLALEVYIHDDHTVKINPLICGPLDADFDGDCVRLFYAQSLAAKAEVIELFSVEKQLLSSHNRKLNLQLGADSLLSLKILFKKRFLDKVSAQQLGMFLLEPLIEAAFSKSQGDQWTASQILQAAFPREFEFWSTKCKIQGSGILNLEFGNDSIRSSMNEIISSIYKEKGPNEVLKTLNSMQSMLMESLFNEGFSVDLNDFHIPSKYIEIIQNGIKKISTLLDKYELVELQIDARLRLMTKPIADFIVSSSRLGNIIDTISDSAITKVVQQMGFLGFQLSEKGKLYTKMLVDDVASFSRDNYPFLYAYPMEEFGLVKSCFFHGLDPFQEMVHSISAREVMVRSSGGLTEPGTLFKNLMAILRDVIICYDGTVRNMWSNNIIQFQYGVEDGSGNLFDAGEPVGVLAATAVANPAYKAVLDSSSSSNSSWEMMKEILLCAATFKNDLADRKVILYLSDCDCGRKYCREKAAYVVKNHLKKVSLKDIAVEFSIEYKYNRQQIPGPGSPFEANLLGHVHLDKEMFQKLNISMIEICEKVQARIDSFLKQKGMKKKTIGHQLKRLNLSTSVYCCFGNEYDAEMPCLKIFWQDLTDINLDETSQALAHSILPVILETIIKGDPRVCTVNIVWVAPDTTAWIKKPSRNQNGELALEILLEKKAIKQSGDAWRIVMDSCLRVIHLIDTTRSTPNSIKQVHENLGISSAFNQVVERLSTSVSMVSKGVLKEHIILLANNMTSTGDLIGFNKGGIKALSKSSNIKLPFTEATLFTPKKCFEKAAEKYDTDSLSSTVSSCSWGKEVSVGTGSHFDILWGAREEGKDQKEEIDVYDFLHLVNQVRRSSKKKGTESASLGADVDDLDEDHDNGEWGMSPERCFVKPTFEDDLEISERKNLAFYGSWCSSQKQPSWSWDRTYIPKRSGGLGSSQKQPSWDRTFIPKKNGGSSSSQKGKNQPSWDRTYIQKKNGGSGSGSSWQAKSAQRDIPPSNPCSGRFSRGAKPDSREQNYRSGGCGTSRAGEWKQKSSFQETSTRQHLSMYTYKEQEILKEIEPIMTSIRRIMNQSGYKDGHPLSAGDQNYIIKNVFNHHPEKTAKMGVGIDYVTVNKHSRFQGSRCLYVILKDGYKEDFSYRKCLENLVKTKYPNLAKSFNEKYFQKSRHPRK